MTSVITVLAIGLLSIIIGCALVIIGFSSLYDAPGKGWMPSIRFSSRKGGWGSLAVGVIMIVVFVLILLTNQ